MRRNECLRYAAETGLEIVVDNYDHREWQCIARGLEKEPEKGLRCTECFLTDLFSLLYTRLQENPRIFQLLLLKQLGSLKKLIVKSSAN